MPTSICMGLNKQVKVIAASARIQSQNILLNQFCEIARNEDSIKFFVNKLMHQIFSFEIYNKTESQYKKLESPTPEHEAPLLTASRNYR